MAGSSVLGVFDSGVGGLSVLRALRAQWPRADLLYVADSGHAPYGEKPVQAVLARAQAVAAWLHAQGCCGLVVACNTATAAAVEPLRGQWPGWPIVGVEPGLKPALARSGNGRVAVLATQGTLASERYARLQRHAGQAVLDLPCPGLAAAIEADDPAALAPLLDDIAQRLREAAVDTVVLGCTHYPFIASALQARLGHGVHLLDTGEAIARRAAALLPQAAQGGGSLGLYTTGQPPLLAGMARRWLGVDAAVQPLAV